MTQPKLVLHNYWRSSASYRTRIGLGLKQLAFEYVAVNIVKRDQFTDAYRAKNPMSQVPTLEITEADGSVTSLVQSLPILEYLDERFGGAPLLPKAPVLRARTRALAEIVNSGIQPLQNLAVHRALKAVGVDEQAWSRPFIAEGLAAFEQSARDVAGQFSVGDSPTIADCVLIPQLFSSRRFGVDVSHFELLLGIEQRCLQLPAFANAHPDRQPDAVNP